MAMATDGNDGNGNTNRDNVEPSVVVVEVVAVDPVVARSWGVVLALGILAVIVGIVFLVSLKVAVFTLVIIVALALFVSGLIEFALAHAYRSPAVGYVIGVIWIAVGIMALVWPKATLFVVAFLVGIGLLLAGWLAMVVYAYWPTGITEVPARSLAGPSQPIRPRSIVRQASPSGAPSTGKT